MSFPIDHWKNPRKTIATKFQFNDIAYATHGAIIAMEGFEAINLPPSELKKMTLLDYGCGTGRASRVFSRIFGRVIGYDPVKECIDLANTECADMSFPNLSFTTDINEVPECDIAVSINVIEHLDWNASKEMINNLKTKVAGTSYIWYSVRRNTELLGPHIPRDLLALDKAASDAAGGDKIVIRSFNFREINI